MTEQPVDEITAALQQAAQPMSDAEAMQRLTNPPPAHPLPEPTHEQHLAAQQQFDAQRLQQMQQNAQPPQQLATPQQVAQAQQPQQQAPPQSQLYSQATTTAPVEGEDFLANLGLDNVPDSVANDTYPAVLLSGNAGTYDDKDTGETRQYVSFTWKIDNPASEFHGEVLDGDFCNAHPGIDNKAKRRLRDRLLSIRLPTQGVGNQDRMNQLLESKKGCPVWIKTYKLRNGNISIVEIAARDASMQAQMGQQPVTQAGLAQQANGLPPVAVQRDY